MWERACRPLSVVVTRACGPLTYMYHICHRGLHDCTICPNMLAWNGERMTPADPEHEAYWDRRLARLFP